MIQDTNKIGLALKEICDKWQYSGSFAITHHNELVHNEQYGYQHKEKGIRTNKDTRYTLNSKELFFAGLAALIAVEQGYMSLEDTLSDYLGEFKHAKDIKIEHLLRGKTGIADYYTSKILVSFEEDEKVNKMDIEDRIRHEKTAKYIHSDFETVLSLIKDEALENEPGEPRSRFSNTNEVFLAEVVERVTEQSVLDFLTTHLFNPFGMTGVSHSPAKETQSYLEYNNSERTHVRLDEYSKGLFSLTIDDAMKLMELLRTRQLFSKELWDRILTYDEEARGLLIDNVSGYECISTYFLGFRLNFYMNSTTGVAYTSLTNEEQVYKNENNSWTFFNKESRMMVSSFTTFPQATKMVEIDKTNFWETLGLSIEDYQNNFVLDAKSSVAMALMFPTKKAFVQMEGDQVIGLLVLDIDPERNDYNIDIIIIDKLFQNKGYGKLIVKWAVDYLTGEGAKSLSIGVSRMNEAAKKVYLNAGFTPRSVRDGGMQLKLDIV